MINDLLKQMIETALSERKDKHGWSSGLFSRIHLLTPDQRGELGEKLLEQALHSAGVKDVTREGALDRTKKHWDIRTADMDIEVKTATLGRNVNTFQHENIEKDRQYDAVAFVDIAPNEIYLTWTAKKNIPFRNMHRRSQGIVFKWDLQLSTVKNNKVETIEDILRGYNAVKEELKGA